MISFKGRERIILILGIGINIYVGCSSVGRTVDCDSEGRGFESRHPPHAGVAQLVEHCFCKAVVAGSIPVSGSISGPVV
jgi:hypothetical protein